MRYDPFGDGCGASKLRKRFLEASTDLFFPDTLPEEYDGFILPPISIYSIVCGRSSLKPLLLMVVPLLSDRVVLLQADTSTPFP